MEFESVHFLFDTSSKIIIAAFKNPEDAHKVKDKLNKVDKLNTIDRLELKINKLLCSDNIDKEEIKKITYNICQMKNSTDNNIIYKGISFTRYIVYGLSLQNFDDFDFEHIYKKCLMLNI
jgi:hypothetical protein